MQGFKGQSEDLKFYSKYNEKLPKVLNRAVTGSKVYFFKNELGCCVKNCQVDESGKRETSYVCSRPSKR